MKRSDPPQAYGVFKPVGHVVMSFPSERELEAATSALGDAGRDAGCARYRPDQMLAQIDADLREASPLASLGQEMNLVKAHRELAARGYSFLVVPTPQTEDVERVAEVARRSGAYTAQHYGHFVIEELVDRTPERTQAFESPDRGLDMAVPDADQGVGRRRPR
jgi:hypothetical protein